MATCKDLDALRQQFPCAPAWGQPGLAGETDEDNDEEAAPSVQVGNGPHRSSQPRTTVQTFLS